RRNARGVDRSHRTGERGQPPDHRVAGGTGRTLQARPADKGVVARRQEDGRQEVEIVTGRRAQWISRRLCGSATVAAGISKRRWHETSSRVFSKSPSKPLPGAIASLGRFWWQAVQRSNVFGWRFIRTPRKACRRTRIS